MILAAAAQAARGDNWETVVETIAGLLFLGFVFWLMMRD